MLGWDEKPRPELFVADGLHLSAEGYQHLERRSPARSSLPPVPLPAAGPDAASR